MSMSIQMLRSIQARKKALLAIETKPNAKAKGPAKTKTKAKAQGPRPSLKNNERNGIIGRHVRDMVRIVSMGHALFCRSI
jgi:hypothetical protein